MNREHPAIFHSARVHFGCLRSAYQQIRIPYPHEEVQDWRTKVEPFLGKVTDKLIAEVVGQPIAEVRKLRRSKGIPRYKRGNEKKIVIAAVGEPSEPVATPETPVSELSPDEDTKLEPVTA